MKIYKITEASEYLGVSINTLKTLANNGKIKSFKTTGKHRRFRQEDLDAYMGVEKLKARANTLQKDLDRAHRTHGITISVGDSRDPSDLFKSYTGEVIDIGYSDHGYVVESKELNEDIKGIVTQLAAALEGCKE